MKLRQGILVVVAALALTAHVDVARAEESLKAAQAAFDDAQINYLSGKYDEAAEGFKTAYAARPFPQFLYNIGASFHMKGKKQSDVAAYGMAVDYYKRYLSEDKTAPDRAKVERSVAIIEAEIARLKAAPAPADPANPTQPAAAPQSPSQEMQQLGDVKVRGLVVIESEPQGANIYIDGKQKGPVAQTPWSGSLDGEHTYLVEKRGHKAKEGRIAPDPSKLLVLQIVLSEEDYLGWLEVKSNVPGADVYIDDPNLGAAGKTPFSQNFKPGKHTIWIRAEGYDEYKSEIEIIAGETHEVTGMLKGAPVGYVNLRGAGIEDSAIYMDGKVLCERGPCRKAVAEGAHTITVKRSGRKSYSRRIEVQAKTETAIKVNLARKPSRSEAVVAYILSGIFAGGGIYLYKQAGDTQDEADLLPAGAERDDKEKRADIFKYSSYGSFGLAGVTLLTAIYYTFRDKGPPSTATVDVQALALTPQLGPDYAGLGLAMRF